MDIHDPITSLAKIGPSYSKKLAKIDISTIYDLLMHIPSRYIDFSNNAKISSVKIGELVTIKGIVTSFKNQYTRTGKKIQLVSISDDSGSMLCIWFNQPYLIMTLKKNTHVALSGIVNFFGRSKALISPEYEIVIQQNKGIHTGRLLPIYPETKGVSSKWLRGKISTAWELYNKDIKEFLQPKLLRQLKYPKLSQAIYDIHFPKNENQAKIARERLAFNELLFLHLRSLRNKHKWQKNEVVNRISFDKKIVDEFINSLPFELTSAQNRVIEEITSDLKNIVPMNRLLEGDVGSGKTVVAAVACFISFINGHQSVIMAPTQLLAQQHFETINSLFKNYKTRISLITSSKKYSDLGKSDIIIGTHALIHKGALFENTAVIVIDEQHKFGVKQRAHLIKKGKKKNIAPHVLTLTATPIPRTVALTAYGDLDLSILDEMPTGRKKVTTWIVPNKKRASAYQWIKDKINKEDIQVFVVCPLIEESEIETMKQIKAVKSEFEKLKNEFKGFNVGLLHGKLKSYEKDLAIDKFKKGKTNILVSTPVVEVGIDVGNANIMIIEAADRFGLAQLHQLRGRVGRGNVQAYCLLFSESKSQKSLKRLNALKKEASGFKLSEIDLSLRGPGELFGLKQHGYPELKIASWQDINLIKNAKNYAKIIDEDRIQRELIFHFLDLLNITN